MEFGCPRKPFVLVVKIRLMNREIVLLIITTGLFSLGLLLLFISFTQQSEPIRPISNDYKSKLSFMLLIAASLGCSIYLKGLIESSAIDFHVLFSSPVFVSVVFPMILGCLFVFVPIYIMFWFFK